MSNAAAAISYTERYLTMVTQNNNNKFYHMITNPDKTTFTVIYGRIGQNGARCTYPIYLWNTKYTEKIQKGYTDQSDLVFENKNDDSAKAEEKSESKKKTVCTEALSLMKRLATFAKSFVKRNYIIKDSQIKVTSLMINKVDELLQELGEIKNKKPNFVSLFNSTLSQIFMTIPRVMGDTKNYYAKDPSDYERIIKREADFIDSLRGIAATNSKTNRASFETGSSKEDEEEEKLITKLGLSVHPVTAKQEAEIKGHMGQNAYRYIRAWRVENKTTKEAFDNYASKLSTKNIKMLWHGSRNENFHSILCSGLLLNPNAVITGKMFGHGIYFAPSFNKSFGYTSASGSRWANGNSDTAFMAVFDVALGKNLDVHSYDYSFGSYTERDIKKHGCDSLYAHKGQMLYNDEIIVYNENATTIRYLVEVSA